MDTVVFKPKYGFFRVYLGLMFAFIIGVVVIIMNTDNLGYVAFGCILCFAGVFGSRSYPREIVFQQHKVVVRSWFFPEKVVDYNSVKNVNGAAIVFGEFGGVPLFNMENSEELIKTINSFSGYQGSLSVKPQETQIAEMRSSRNQMRTVIYIVVAILVFLGVFIGYFGISIDLRAIVAVATLTIVVSIFFISRRKTK